MRRGVSTRNAEKAKKRNAIDIADDTEEETDAPVAKGAKTSTGSGRRAIGYSAVASGNNSRPSYASAAQSGPITQSLSQTPSVVPSSSSSVAITSQVAEGGQPPPPAAIGCPLNVPLLSSFGGFDRKTVTILEDFFDTIIHNGDEDVARGLGLLAVGLQRAVEAFSLVSKNLQDATGQLQQMEHAKISMEQRKDSEIARLKESIATQANDRRDDIYQLRTEVGARDASIADLKLKLDNAKAETASALSEFSDHQTRFQQEKTELDLRIKTMEDGLADLHKKSDMYASVLAKFSDPVTGVQRRCPLIQNNGVVQSFDVLINVWIKEQDMGQSHAFRMFTCPVTKTFSMISPVPILDAFMKVAASAGVDTSLPIVFHYTAIAGGWVEFSFHEQLELVARLCSIYRDRHNAERLPEQRSVSIPGEGSVVILMRSVMMGLNGFKLECFGMHNDGRGRMEIKVVIDPKWIHPFDGMVFPEDSA